MLKKIRKCKYYNEYIWGEPPLEEGEKGTLHKEFECKISRGYFVATCDGRKENCDLPDNQNRLKISRLKQRR